MNFVKEGFIVWTPLTKCTVVSLQNTLERRLISAWSGSLLIFIWKTKPVEFKPVIYYDAQTSNTKYLQNLQVEEKKLFSSEEPSSRMGEHWYTSQSFLVKGKGQLYKKSEPCEFENYESLDEKGMSRNVLQQLVNI